MGLPKRNSFSPANLARLLIEARERTLDLVADLTDEQMIGPRISIVNPLRWEIGHVAWFQEFWVLRHLRGHRPLLEGGDSLYNSAEVVHDTRWDLRLPTREKTLEYMAAILHRVINPLGSSEPSEAEIYFPLLATFHEDMHDEAMTYTRQTLGYPAPKLNLPREEDLPSARGLAPKVPVPVSGGPLSGDVEIPGGTFMVGATPDLPFVFDNEKWAHPVVLKPFSIARAPVTNAEFAAFVDDGGYRRRKLWSADGRRWLESGGAPSLEQSFSRLWSKQEQKSHQASPSGKIEHPVYWERGAGQRWFQRVFDTLVPLRDHLPVIHVNWFEAEAYCNWAGRRLPTEAEWEAAASAEPSASGLGFSERRRRYPWGDEPPTPDRANLDGRNMGCVEVGALPGGDSPFGCRQMIGNVWEWTASDFQPYPGFVLDPYKEYSAPWFGTHKVLRGGCWTTRSRLIRNTWRNFYTPDRWDVWAGFRTRAK